MPLDANGSIRNIAPPHRERAYNVARDPKPPIANDRLWVVNEYVDREETIRH